MAESNNNTVLVGLLSLVIGAGGAYLLTQNMAGDAQFSPNAGLSRAEVMDIVRDTIADEPELIVESLQSMQRKAQEAEQREAAAKLGEKRDLLEESETSPVVGAKDPEVTVVEFFDYQCGYCKRITPVIAQALEEHKDVRVVFKEFPILSAGSRLAAQASLAVSRLKPEEYFNFHTRVIEHKGQYTQSVLEDIAKDFGIKAADLKKEMQADWVNQELNETKKLAQELGIRGTPALVVGEELVPGAVSYSALKELIEKERAD
jgi:protein-disulfide isomerase